MSSKLLGDEESSPFSSIICVHALQQFCGPAKKSKDVFGSIYLWLVCVHLILNPAWELFNYWMASPEHSKERITLYYLTILPSINLTWHAAPTTRVFISNSVVLPVSTEGLDGFQLIVLVVQTSHPSCICRCSCFKCKKLWPTHNALLIQHKTTNRVIWQLSDSHSRIRDLRPTCFSGVRGD